MREFLIQYVADHPGVSLETLFALDFAADDIYALLAENAVYTDLEVVRLDDTRRVLFFRDRHVARGAALIRATKSVHTMGLPLPIRIGSEIGYAGSNWTVAEFTGSKVLLVRKDGERTQSFSRDVFETLRNRKAVVALSNPEDPGKDREIINTASPKAMARALKDMETLSRASNGQKAKELGMTERTWRRKKRKLEDEGFGGLIPHYDRRGNRKPRDYIDEDAIRQGIEEFHETPIRPSITATAEHIQKICRKKGTHEPSYETVRRRVQKRDRVKQIAQREGYKAANAAETVIPDEPRPCIDVPFGRVHIDHTKMDIETRDGKNGLKRRSARVWITRAVDECTRVTLARSISRNPPSYVSLMRVLKKVGEKYGRLPATIIADGGREFESIAFETLLAFYNVKMEWRRKGNGPDGWPVERSFRSLNTEFLYRLPGNTQATRNVRQMTPQTNPKNQDLLTLEDLEERLASYLDDYHNSPHDGLDGESPFQKWDRVSKFAGTVSDNDIKDMDEFRILVLPPVSGGGTRTILRQGVKVENTWYVCEQMRDGTLRGQKILVKEDPDNRGHVMVYIGKCWVEARSRDYFELANLAPEERAIESEEIQARRGERKWRKREYKSSRSAGNHKSPTTTGGNVTQAPAVPEGPNPHASRKLALQPTFRLRPPKRLEEIR